MAYRRSKEQPPALQQNGQLSKKLNVQYSYRAPSKKIAEATNTGKTTAASSNSTRSLFKYDVSLIFNDLKKTIFITIFIFILLFVINWYLKR
jgi:hypothetical protein